MLLNIRLWGSSMNTLRKGTKLLIAADWK